MVYDDNNSVYEEALASTDMNWTFNKNIKIKQNIKIWLLKYMVQIRYDSEIAYTGITFQGQLKKAFLLTTSNKKYNGYKILMLLLGISKILIFS